MISLLSKMVYTRKKEEKKKSLLYIVCQNCASCCQRVIKLQKKAHNSPIKNVYGSNTKFRATKRRKIKKRKKKKTIMELSLLNLVY
jgi:hypothetical protein